MANTVLNRRSPAASAPTGTAAYSARISAPVRDKMPGRRLFRKSVDIFEDNF